MLGISTGLSGSLHGTKPSSLARSLQGTTLVIVCMLCMSSSLARSLQGTTLVKGILDQVDTVIRFCGLAWWQVHHAGTRAGECWDCRYGWTGPLQETKAVEGTGGVSV